MNTNSKKKIFKTVALSALVLTTIAGCGKDKGANGANANAPSLPPGPEYQASLSYVVPISPSQSLGNQVITRSQMTVQENTVRQTTPNQFGVIGGNAGFLGTFVNPEERIQDAVTFASARNRDTGTASIFGLGTNSFNFIGETATGSRYRVNLSAMASEKLRFETCARSSAQTQPQLCRLTSSEVYFSINNNQTTLTVEVIVRVQTVVQSTGYPGYGYPGQGYYPTHPAGTPATPRY